MHKIGPCYLNFPNSNCPEPNLLANHQIAKLYAQIQDLESQVEKKRRSIHALYQNGSKYEGLENLQDLAETSNKVIEAYGQLSGMQKMDPQAILDYIKTGPFYEDPMNREERSLFIKIEEALGDPEILRANVSEVNRFQLGILWNEYNQQNLSDRLFDYLIAIRIKTFTSEKIKKKEESFVKFQEINGALYRRSPASMCELIHNTLINGQDCEEYKIAMETFHKRLQGILDEQIERRFYKLSKRLPQKLPISQETALLTPSDLPLQRPQLTSGSSTEIPSQKLETVEGCETVDHPVDLPNGQVKYFLLRATTMEWIALFLPEDQKDLISTDASIDDLLKNNLEKNNLFKIMEKSLLGLSKILEIKKNRSLEYNITKINDVTIEFLQNNRSKKKKSDSKESIKKIEEIIDECNAECENYEHVPLRKTELINYYFDNLGKFISEKKNQDLQKIKKASGPTKFFKKSKPIAKDTNIFYLYEEIGELESFCLVNRLNPIYIFNKKDL